MKWILLFIFLIPLVSADIISINSYQSGEAIISGGTKEIEGFFFGEIPSGPIGPVGAGGTGINPLIKQLNVTICEASYFHLLEFGNEYEKISILKDKLENGYNITISILALKNKYLDSFQNGCSYVINYSLRPDYLCFNILNFSEENSLTPQDRLDFRLMIKDDLFIFPSVLDFYFDNFDLRCGDFIEKKIIITKKSIILWILFLILILICLIFLWDYHINKKRMILKIKKHLKR